MTGLTGDPAFANVNSRIDEIHDLTTLPEEVAHAAIGGLLTGGKAVINGTATAVKNVVTLGLNSAELELIGVTKEDRANGYNSAVAIATASGQVLIAVGTGGLAGALAKGGRVAKAASGALLVFDAAGNAVGVVQGLADASANGLNLRNGAQIAASAVGLGANGAALKKLLGGGATKTLRPVDEAPHGNDPDVEIKRPDADVESPDADVTGPEVEAKPTEPGTALVPSASYELGKWGEARLAQDFGGQGFKPSKAFKTSLTTRFVDRLIGKTAHEAKAGKDVRLDASIRTQILKDAELLATGKFDAVVWHFYRGVNDEVLDFLKKHGIDYVVHP
jgi:hypothetical protein